MGFPTHQQSLWCKYSQQKWVLSTYLSRGKVLIRSVILFQVRQYVNDIAKIYSITVTNAMDGSASGCHACAVMSQQDGSSCVPCPAGHFINKDTNQCQECPLNTFLSGHHIYGQEACQPCGPGSKNNKVWV